MKVSSTEVQNNFGKYLMLAAQEEIIITRNGLEIAELSAVKDMSLDSDSSHGLVAEKSENLSYGNYGGKKVPYEEFLELTKDTEKRYEYIDGKMYLMTSPKTAHQIALTELFVTFYNWFQGKKCTTLVGPYDITLRRNLEDINVVQPDIMVICDLEDKLDKNDNYQGIPTLIVEILSEETRSKDLIKKVDLYMSCDVKEYWIVNPLNKEVTIYFFKDRNINSNITYRKSESVKSHIFSGLSAELDKVFR